jgi:hypothetical protein
VHTLSVIVQLRLYLVMTTTFPLRIINLVGDWGIITNRREIP